MNFENFLEKYNKESDLIKKLELMYDLFDESTDKIKTVEFLLRNFNDWTQVDFHLSEIKTVLVISKPFKDNKEIKELRELLIYTYNKEIKKFREQL